MPRRDGTGPMGQGLKTGRRMGNCQVNGETTPAVGLGRGRRNSGRGNGQGLGLGFRHGQNINTASEQEK